MATPNVLTLDQRTAIAIRHIDGRESQSSLAAEFKLSQPAVAAIVKAYRKRTSEAIQASKAPKAPKQPVPQAIELSFDEPIAPQDEPVVNEWPPARIIKYICAGRYDEIPDDVPWHTYIQQAEKVSSAQHKQAQADKTRPPRGPSFESTFNIIQRVIDIFRIGMRVEQDEQRRVDFMDTVALVTQMIAAEHPEIVGGAVRATSDDESDVENC